MAVCGTVLAVLSSSNLSGRERYGSEEDGIIATFENDMDTPIMKEYINFLATHQKTYASSLDIKKRYSIFKENFLKIVAHNSNPLSTFEMGVNKYSDQTAVEFEEGVIKGIRIRPEHASKVKALASSHELTDLESQKGLREARFLASDT